jgi:hypothetical protein
VFSNCKNFTHFVKGGKSKKRTTQKSSSYILRKFTDRERERDGTQSDREEANKKAAATFYANLLIGRERGTAHSDKEAKKKVERLSLRSYKRKKNVQNEKKLV